MSLPPIRFIGIISYSAYLWHQPLIAFSNLQNLLILPSVWRYFEVILSLVLAWLTWKYIEQPFRYRIGNKRPFSLIFGISFAVGTIGVILFAAINYDPVVLPTYRRALRYGGDDILRYVTTEKQAKDCGNTLSTDTSVHVCRFGSSLAPITLVLWGDSYAQAILKGLDRVATAHQLAGYAYFMPGCPPVLGVNNPLAMKCTSGLQYRVLFAIAHRPEKAKVFVIGNLIAMNWPRLTVDGHLSTYKVVDSKIQEAASILAKYGKSLTIIEQGPTFTQSVARFYLRSRLTGDSSNLAESLQNRSLTDKNYEMWNHGRINVIRTSALFCNRRDCPALDTTGHLVTRDNDHPTDISAIKLAKLMLKSH